MRFSTLFFISTLMAAPAFGGDLQVIQRMPSGEMDSLNAAREVVVTFNEPMVALSDNAGMGAACPIHLSPSLPGRCRWRGSNTVAFELQGFPKPGTEYSVLVPKGTASQVSGDKLAEDQRWTFVTPRPRLMSSAPGQDQRWVSLDPKLFLSFNQPMDPAKAKDYLALEEASVDETDPELDPSAVTMKNGLAEALRTKVLGSAAGAQPQRLVPMEVSALSKDQWEALVKSGALQGASFAPAGPGQDFMLLPQRRLKPDKRYRLWIGAGMPGAGGAVGTARTQVVAFETYATFHSQGVGGEQACPSPAGPKFKGSALRSPYWAFTNPVDPDSFFSHLKITPAPPEPAGQVEQADPEQNGGDEDGDYGDDGENQGGGSSFAGPVVSGQAIKLESAYVDGRKPGHGLLPLKRPVDAPFPRACVVSLGDLRLKVGQTYHFEVSPGLKDAFGNVLDQAIAYDQTVPDYCPDLDVPGGFSVLESYLKPRHPADGLNIKDPEAKLWSFGRDGYVPAMRSLESYQQAGFPGDPSQTIAWTMDAPVNVRSKSYFDLQPALGVKHGGLVGFTMPGSHGGLIRGLDDVTDLGLTLKTAPHGTLAWVTRLKEGQPAAGVPVELRRADNSVAWKGASDAHGLVKAPGYLDLGATTSQELYNARPSLYAIADSPDGAALLSSGRITGIEPWRFSVPFDEAPEEKYLRGLVYTDRGVYKPGESVKAKGVFRSLIVDDWGLPREEQVSVSVQDSRGNEMTKRSLTLNARGAFDFSYDLPQGCPTGQYTLSVAFEAPASEDAPPSKKAQRHHRASRQRSEQSIGFRVEAFKPAAFEVRVHNPRPEAYFGEDLSADVEGWYLYGAPMSEAPATWELMLTPSDFTPPGWDDYDFSRGWWEEEDRGTRSAGSGSLTLTAKGLGDLSAKTEGLELKGPYVATYEVGVTSPDRQRLFGRSSQVVHPSRYYVGAKLDGRVVEMGQRLPALAVVTDTQGHPVPGVQMQVQWRRREHVSVRRVGLHGRLTWEHSSKDVSLPEVMLKSGDKPKALDFRPDKPGQYYLNIKVADPQGRVNECAAMVYVAGEGESWWDQEDHELIQLVADKKDYKVGDEAKVMVQSPWDEAEALVTVERERVIDSWTVHLKGGSALVHVPIKAGYLPNVFVGVTLIRGRLGKQDYGPDGLDLSKPQARFGYVELPVHPEGRQLAVTVALDKEDYRPGATVKADLTAVDAAGGAEPTELTVWAVDEGVLQLTGYQVPDLFGAFYGPRPLYVLTGDTRLHVLGQRDYGEKGQDRGGGGGAGDMAGIELRGDFRYLAHWSATVLTDAQGRAHVEFKLPDNLSAFRLMVSAHTLRRFGKAQRRFTVSKPLMLRPSLPRFARVGDAFLGGVVLHNNGHQDALVDLLIKAGPGSAISVSGAAKRQVPVGAGKAVEVLWPMQAASLGKASLEIRASAKLDGLETDGLLWTLPVTLPEKRETVATAGVCEDPVTEELRLPASGLAETGDVTATFSSTALGGLKDGVSYLLDYPHGCLEQRMSRVLPIVSGAALLEAFKLQDLGGQKKAAQDVLDHLPDYQCGGGYIYWGNCGMESPSPWLTAYVLEVAKLAKDEGYKVPDESLQKAVEWLKGVFDEHQRWGYPYSQSELFVMRAYALEVLSLYGTSPTGYLSQLYGRRDQLPFLAKAHVLKAAQLLGGDDSVPKTLAQEILNQAKFEPRSMHFELPEGERMPWVHGSTVQATAECLEALLTARGGFPGDEKAVAWLTGERRDGGAWRNTQENAWGLRAFNAYFKRYESTPPSFTASLSLLGQGADKLLWQQPFEGRALETLAKTLPFDQVFGTGQEARLRFAKQGQGRLYYGVTMKYVPRRFDQPAMEGFEVTRKVSDLGSGTAVTGPLVAGRRYKVDLAVKTGRDRTFVALVDALPGGVEVVNTDLADESQAQAAGVGTHDWYDSFMHSEAYDDRLEVFANFMSAGEHHWTYLVQATTPGRFAQPATWVDQMYEPEVFGRTASQLVEVVAQP